MQPWTKETIVELYERHGWGGIVESFNSCLAAEREDSEHLSEQCDKLREQLAAERERYIELCDKANGDMIALNKQLAAERDAWQKHFDGLADENQRLRDQLAAERGKMQRVEGEFAIMYQNELKLGQERDTLRDQLAAFVDALKLAKSHLAENIVIGVRQPHLEATLNKINVALAKMADQPVQCKHEYDVCVGPANDPRLGKRICNFCGELEPARDQPVQLPMINDDPVIELK